MTHNERCIADRRSANPMYAFPIHRVSRPPAQKRTQKRTQKPTQPASPHGMAAGHPHSFREWEAASHTRPVPGSPSPGKLGNIFLGAHPQVN